jgi:hypothetical protein
VFGEGAYEINGLGRFDVEDFAEGENSWMADPLHEGDFVFDVVHA